MAKQAWKTETSSPASYSDVQTNGNKYFLKFIPDL